MARRPSRPSRRQWKRQRHRRGYWLRVQVGLDTGETTKPE